MGFLIIRSCEALSSEAAETPILSLKLLQKLRKETCYPIQLEEGLIFLTRKAGDRYPSCVTAAGFFKINYKVLFQILQFVFTQIYLLFQIKDA